MKRRVIQRRVVMFLLLLGGGAIVNVAVAWGCALSTNTESDEVVLDRLAETDWLERFSARWQVTVGSLTAYSNTNLVIITVYASPNPRPIDPNEHYVVVQQLTSGWPRIGLRGERLIYLKQDFAVSGKRRHHGSIDLGDSLSSPVQNTAELLPLIPDWPGFAINTIFYAVILWVVFFVPGMVKRTLRRRRNLCPACAYPVGTSSVCTECGRELQCSNSNQH